nr:5-methylcytosine-specific restriction endonuclease system specificity protein McrC [Metabacillus iocasae]
MLAYAYQTLNEASFKSIQAEEFNHIHDLMAAILIRGVKNQVKRGLHRDYKERSDVTGHLRGKIDVTNSVKQNTMIMQKMVCRYDEFSENTQLNQILKTTMQLLIQHGEVNAHNRKELRKVTLFFNHVSTVQPYSINWSAIPYHRNNATYKLLMNICQLVLKGLLMTTDDGEHRMREFLDDQQMHRLYEKFLLSYFKKEYPHFSARASYIEWNVDDDISDFLPAMKSDVTLTHKGKTLIIDAKYYARTMQTHAMFHSKTLISSHLYQMFTYVKNKDRAGSGTVSGVILYAKTDEDITPDHDYQISGNRFSVKTLDLSADWEDIVKQLGAVAGMM